MNNIISFIKKRGAIALCLIATIIFATTAYAGMNNLGPGSDYEFDVEIYDPAKDNSTGTTTDQAETINSKTSAVRGANNQGGGDDYEFDVPVEDPSTNTQIIIDIVNTHEVYLVDIVGTKTWIDNDNQDGTRPDEITIHLYADGESTGKSTILSEATSWKYKFENLPAYADGVKINYSVIEEPVDGYTAKYVPGA